MRLHRDSAADRFARPMDLQEACWTISNITAGTKEQIQGVVEAGILPPLVHLLGTAEFDIKKVCARVSTAEALLRLPVHFPSGAAAWRAGLTASLSSDAGGGMGAVERHLGRHSRSDQVLGQHQLYSPAVRSVDLLRRAHCHRRP